MPELPPGCRKLFLCPNKLCLLAFRRTRGLLSSLSVFTLVMRTHKPSDLSVAVFYGA